MRRDVSNHAPLLGSMAVMGKKAAYWQKVKNTFGSALIAYWPLGEPSGSVITDVKNGNNGTYNNFTLGVTGIGDGKTGVSSSGTAYGQLYSTGLNTLMSKTEASFSIWFKVASGQWTDGTARNTFFIAADFSNYFAIQKKTVSNYINGIYAAGGTVKNADVPCSATTWQHIVMTVSQSNNRIRMYLNGTKIGADVTGLGTWTGNLANDKTGLASRSGTSAAVPWIGSLAHLTVYNREITASEVAVLAAPFDVFYPKVEHYNAFPEIWQSANASSDTNTYLYGRQTSGTRYVTRKLLTGQTTILRGLVTDVDPEFYPEQVIGTATPDLVFVLVAKTLYSGQHYLLRSTDGGVTFANVLALGAGNGAGGADSTNVHFLNQRNFCEIARTYPGGGGVGDLLIGEYNVNTSRVSGGENDRVRILRSTDGGQTWAAIMAWNTSGHQVRHVHAIRQDPYTGYIYFCVGDINNEAALIRWDGATAWINNSTPATIAGWTGFKCATGAQRHRAVDIIISANYVHTGTDATDATETGIWRWSKDLSYGERMNSEIGSYDGTAHVMWSGENLNDILVFRSCRQPVGTPWTKEASPIFASNNEGETWGIVGYEHHEADLTGYAATAPISTFAYNNRMYADAFYGLDFKGTNVYEISGRIAKGSEPITLQPVYYVGNWNAVGVDASGMGKSPDAPVATYDYLINTIGISPVSRVRRA